MADNTDTPVVSFKKRSKAGLRKKPAPPSPPEKEKSPEASESSDEASNSDSDSDAESERKTIKRRRTVGVKADSSTKAPRKQAGVTAEGDGNRDASAFRKPRVPANEATKHADWFDEEAQEEENDKGDELSAKNLLGKTRSKTSSDGAKEADNKAVSQPSGGGTATYKGAANYSSFIQRNPHAPQKQFGPMKAATNVRTITVMDFAPDVCKDYKQTGFCGFGDTCKFLHAREDYAQGWEIDREWEIAGKNKKVPGRTTVASANRSSNKDGSGVDPDVEEAELEKIPFACVICKKPYQNPVVTKCNHYFCEACALKRFRKNPSCAACGAGTGGVFNSAKRLNTLLEKKRERAKKATQDENEEHAEEEAPVGSGESDKQY